MAHFRVCDDAIEDQLYSTELLGDSIKPAKECQRSDYFMENDAESLRLEVKTRPEAVQKQALWCGLKPGLRVLDAGCGPGKVTSILHEMIQPGGSILGIDYSEERIRYAKQHYGQKPGIGFKVYDLTKPLEGLGRFDLVWVRFVLEYYLTGGTTIVDNLTTCLKPGGYLCLLDLDHNCMNHYGLPSRMEQILFDIMVTLEKKHNVDPYAGRKLYAYLYDLGYEDIQVDLMPDSVIYGKVRDKDAFNWIKKVEVASMKVREIFEHYPGGYIKFHADFIRFFKNPRRFTYTPLILCKGMKPIST